MAATARDAMALQPEDLNDADVEILDVLANGRATPQLIREELDAGGRDVTRQYVSQRLKRLREHNHVVNRQSVGVYELVDDPRRPNVDHDAVRAQLEADARERWGDEWTIETQRFADGTEQSYAYHQRGHAEEDVVERERLFPGADGEVYHDHIVVETESVVEVVDRDEPPEKN